MTTKELLTEAIRLTAESERVVAEYRKAEGAFRQLETELNRLRFDTDNICQKLMGELFWPDTVESEGQLYVVHTVRGTNKYTIRPMKKGVVASEQ